MDSIEGAEAPAITEAEAAEAAPLPDFPAPPEGAVPLFLDPPEGAPAPMPATTEAASTQAAADEPGSNPYTEGATEPGPDPWRAMMEGRLSALEKAAGIRSDAG